MQHYFFTTKTSSTILNLGCPQDYLTMMVKKAYELGDHMDQKTNLKGIMSSYWVWNQTDLYNPLMDKIIEIISETYSHELLLTEAWTGIYKEKHHAIEHHHLPGCISFVYYLDAEPTDAPLIFGDNIFKIKPSTDLLIIFPSQTTHSVPPQDSNKPRVIFAGNLIPVVEDKTKQYYHSKYEGYK